MFSNLEMWLRFEGKIFFFLRKLLWIIFLSWTTWPKKDIIAKGWVFFPRKVLELLGETWLQFQGKCDAKLHTWKTSIKSSFSFNDFFTYFHPKKMVVKKKIWTQSIIPIDSFLTIASQSFFLKLGFHQYLTKIFIGIINPFEEIFLNWTIFL